jgi:hypothetical protein
MDDAIVRAPQETELRELSRNDSTCTRNGSFCNIHSKPKVHRKKPMRGWFCNECDNKKRQKWYQNDPRAVMRLSAKVRAKQNGLAFNLKIEDIVIPDICPILGIPLFTGNRNQHENAPTLDRIKPELGYVKDNIRVVCWRVNRIRNDATLDELKKLVAFLEQQQT